MTQKNKPNMLKTETNLANRRKTMKKILFVNNNMNTGGIQKALANLLCELSDNRKEAYDIELMLFSKTGELLDELPKNLKVKQGNFFTESLGITHAEARSKGATCLFQRFNRRGKLLPCFIQLDHC